MVTGGDIIPGLVLNWIDGRAVPAKSGQELDKLSPVSGRVLCRAARSDAQDVAAAVAAAKNAQPGWAAMPAVQRGMLLHKIVDAMLARREEIAEIVARETGKSFQSALGETDGAAQLGLFFASEGQRLYGKTLTSGVADKHSLIWREPVGVAGLIVAANTPIANVAWKVFPALVCGNAAVLKTPEDSPATGWVVGRIAHEAGLPGGVLNVVHGYGDEAGAALVQHPDVGVVSFTGSTRVGLFIQEHAGRRLAKVSLELGGKNPLVVCDDADLDNALHWSLLSAFSNAGQRCASGSRIIVLEKIYERFENEFVARASKLKVGPDDDDDLGPVINEKQLNNMLSAVEKISAGKGGGKVLVGGHRLQDAGHKSGYYMAPTIIADLDVDDPVSRTELFGPVTCLYRVKDFSAAVALANDSDYGLTASIHTQNIHRAIEFSRRVKAGTVVINGGTFGSEPHMPFGGLRQSGNGTREPGTEALDVYSNLKTVSINISPEKAE